MIAKFTKADRFEVKGRIGLGCKAVKANCHSCKQGVTALKIDDAFLCSVCETPVTPIPGEREFTQSTPYFVLPKEVRTLGMFPEKPVSLRVIPAYKTLEKTIPNSYSKFTSAGTIFCSGDGVKARRYQRSNGSNKGAYTDIPCSSECPERLNRSCKPSATFYVVLPDIDMFAAYKVISHSEQSIEHIISGLKKLMGRDGTISRVICELKIVEKRKQESTSSIYRVLELSLPAISLSTLQGLGVTAIDYQEAPVVNSSGDTLSVTSQEEEGQEGTTEAKDDPHRVRKGRAAVKEKIRNFVDDPYAERALELYACEKFHTDLFADLTVEDLLQLWHWIKKESEVVDRVFFLSKELKYGKVEDLPFGETTRKSM